MTKYEITGMSCAACSARVEKSVCALPGVESCTVSLLTNSMAVEGSVPAPADHRCRGARRLRRKGGRGSRTSL